MYPIIIIHMITSMIGCHCTGISLKNSLKLLPILLKYSSIGGTMDLAISDEKAYEWNVYSMKITIKHSLRFYSHKTLKYEVCTPNRKNNQSECHIQWIRCSDWTILEYKYKIHTRKFYDSEVWSLRLFDVCVLSSFVLFFIFVLLFFRLSHWCNG